MTSLRTIQTALVFTLIQVAVAVASVDYLLLSENKPVVVKLPKNGSVLVEATGIMDNVEYILCQTHTQSEAIILSSKAQVLYGTSISGKDVGMVTKVLSATANVSWFIFSNSTEDLNVLVHLTFLTYDDPLPGGCNQEFSLENDPNMKLVVHETKTDVEFQWANTPAEGKKSNCDDAHDTDMDYLLYTHYLPADDFDEDTYLDRMSAILTGSDALKNATYLYTLTNSDGQKSFAKIASYRQRGVIYMIVVRYKVPHASKLTYRYSAYVPVISYGCNIKDKHACHKRDIAGLVVASIGGLIGIFICYYGHKFFKTENFLFGCVIFGLVFYQVIKLESNIRSTGILSLAAILALIGGALLLTLWWRCGVPVLNVLLIGLITGYLFASILFYTPFGNISYWRGHFNYGGTFLCAVLIVPMLLLYFTRFLNIMSCALIGSFAFVTMLDMYMLSGVRYIVVNSLRHGTDQDYINVLVTGPFTTHEICLTCGWLVLFGTGMAFQIYNERKRPPFPPCPRLVSDRDNDLRSLLRAHNVQISAERAPLIRGGSTVNTRQYGAQDLTTVTEEESDTDEDDNHPNV